jgi:membrane protease YdiL (CAAX protease family)
LTRTTIAAVAMPRLRLWAEFLVLFVGTPLVLAYALPPRAMFAVLGVMTAGGIILLHRTPGFHWTELLRGWGRIPWRFALGFVVLTATAAGAATLYLFPDSLLFLPRRAPGLWLTIMLAYPVVSALPQELLFRPLFFRRYGHLFPGRGAAVLANGALFALAHLMYGHPLVLAMTFAGGLVFGWVYAWRGSFPAAVLLHAVAGQIVFTAGLGRLFYSGAVG